MSATIETFIKNWFDDESQRYSLYKNEEIYYQFLEQFKSLSDEECKSLITSKVETKKCYFENVIRVLCYFRTGKINSYKTEVENILGTLLRAKRYSRINQLVNTLKYCNAPLFELGKFSEISAFRCGELNCDNIDIDFNSVTDNANIYFSNINVRRSYYRGSEIYPLSKVLSAFLVGLSEINGSDEILEDIIEIVKASKCYELKKIVISVYANKEDDLGGIHRPVKSERREVRDILVSLGEPYSLQQVGRREIVDELINAKEALHEDGVSSEIYFLLIDKISKKYLALGEKEKYKALQHRIKVRKLKSNWSDLR